MKRCSVLFGMLILSFSLLPAYAVDFQVEIDPIQTFVHPDDLNTYVMGNSPVYMDIKMGNNSGSDIGGFSMTLRFYSPNGDGTIINWIDGGGIEMGGSLTMMNGWENGGFWNITNDINIFNWDGVLPDSMNHTAIGNWPDGDPTLTRLRFHFSALVAGPNISTDVVEICVDQSNAPDPTYDWMFPDGSQFGGPYCFEFLAAPCRCTAPIIDGGPIQLTTGHNIPFNGNWIILSNNGHGDPISGVCAVDDAGNPIGNISINMQGFNWTYNPPCEWIDDGIDHTVTFNPEDAFNGFSCATTMPYTVSLTVTEGGAPEILENFESDILVGIMQSKDVTIELSDPANNDDVTWSYSVSDAATGDVFFDNGYLSFTPYEDDDGTIFRFTIRATDCIGGIDEVEVYFWPRSEALCGDANYDSDINILDVVQLINILYKWNMMPGPLEINDVNSDGAVNILDVVSLINFKYKDGPAPNCPAWE